LRPDELLRGSLLLLGRLSPAPSHSLQNSEPPAADDRPFTVSDKVRG
jgi:hypothetical protein